MKTKKMLSLLLSLILVLSLCTPLAPSALAVDTSDCYVSNQANLLLMPRPTMDGTVNAAEWGEPIIVTSPDHAASTWTPNGYRRNDTAHIDADQRAKIWLTNDSEYIYIACTLDKESQSVALGGSLYRNPMFKIMVGAQGETTALKQVEGFEQRTVVTLSFKSNDGTKASHVLKADAAGTVTNPAYSADNYSQRFDAETGTYHYEMRIPYSMTNIDLAQSNKISISVMVGASKYGSATSGENNRYNIGGNIGGANICGVAADTGAEPKLYQGRSVPITLNSVPDAEYVSNKAGVMPSTAPTMDATVNAAEWGEPIIVTSPTHADANWPTNGYREGNEPNYVDLDQRAKVWLTNDSEYIYVACTLDKEGESLALGGSLSKNPMFKIMVGAQGKTTDLVQVDGFEQRTIVTLNFNSSGDKVNLVEVKENASTTTKTYLGSDNYNLRYDKDTATYHYEMRIPYSLTNIDLDESNKISISIMIGASKRDSARSENNRYNIGGNIGGTNAYGVAAEGVGIAKLYEGHSVQLDLNPSLQYQINNAEGTFKLDKDYAVDRLEIPVDKVLDLNGHTLTADYVVSLGGLVMDSQDGIGGIMIAKNDTADNTHLLSLPANNTALPLYEEGFGYRFFDCEFVHSGRVKGSDYQFGYILKMSDAAFALLKDADSDGEMDADMELGYDITIQVDDKDATLLQRKFKDAIMMEYAQKQLLDDGNTYAAVLRVTGFEQITTQTVTITSLNPQIISGTGVIISALNNEVVYTYSNAQ